MVNRISEVWNSISCLPLLLFSLSFTILYICNMSVRYGANFQFKTKDVTGWFQIKLNCQSNFQYVACFCQITSGNSIIVCTLHRSDWARKRQQAAPNLVSSQPRSPHHYRASLHENFRNEPYRYHCARRGCCLCSRRGRLWSTVLLLLLLLLWPQSSLFITFVIISDCWHKK